MILNRANDYYENDKQRLRGQARVKYRNLFEKEKNKKREYGKKEIPRYVWRKQYQKRLKEYQKTIARIKCLNIIMNKIVF